jgi:DNA repair photolyase
MKTSGRGTEWNPPNRFSEIHVEMSEDEENRPALKTRYFKDSTSTILTWNDSPDVGFDVSINPYRGCEHGCIYCYARPTHEYLGMSAGLDFESKIFVKEKAPLLLREELSKKSWEPQTIAISGVTDAYQPIERQLKITRGCLEVLAECRNPAVIITKSALVTRDVDVLKELAAVSAVQVFVSVTSLDPSLSGILEPRAARPQRRLDVIRELSGNNIPVGVLVAPVISGLTDHELPAILKASAEAGATQAGYVCLRLPLTVAPLFEKWLEDNVPDRRSKVLNRIRSMRGGKLNNSQFGARMRGEGEFAKSIEMLFKMCVRKHGFLPRGATLSTISFRRPTSKGMDQLELF